MEKIESLLCYRSCSTGSSKKQQDSLFSRHIRWPSTKDLCFMFFLAPRLFKVHLRGLEDSPRRWRGNGSQGRREDAPYSTISYGERSCCRAGGTGWMWVWGDWGELKWLSLRKCEYGWRKGQRQNVAPVIAVCTSMGTLQIMRSYRAIFDKNVQI